MSMDTTGCFVGTDGLRIETYTGKTFPLQEIQPDLIDLEDIAHALSLTCRFAGHCRDFYSVAEHSVHVYAYLNGLGHPESVLRPAILHDAAEAYLGDITRPLKVCLPEYRKLEQRLQAAIYERFDAVPGPLAEEAIKQADNAVLRTEAYELMNSGGRLWDFGDIALAPIAVQCWLPAEAKQEFKSRCKCAGLHSMAAEANP